MQSARKSRSSDSFRSTSSQVVETSDTVTNRSFHNYSIFGKAQSEELVIGIESILLMDEMFFCIQYVGGKN